ncbi:hypothetical protein N8D77_12175 [Curtobacterium flaccumfaciens]|uniref:hypothetical protein n=2 Tax=Curtobacterium TaxID=2034 RepID=UPI0011CD70AE|nr:hypothetical protein [Curtobacterium flaccumfaciens]UXN20910.1 hypothetical protein N8D77_12175 [Curtobacterium flaccumfaciens pv. flaccumfaciens]
MTNKRDRYRELPEERWARQIVAAELGVAVDRFEDGSVNGMVDAVIRHPPGDVPLEVVRDVNVPEQRQSAALRQHGHFIPVPGLNPGWYVSLTTKANVRDVHQHLPGLLLHLDEIMDDRPDWARSTSLQMDSNEIPRPLRRLGVYFMSPLFDAPGPGQIVLAGEGWGNSGEIDRLNSWVLEVLDREADVPAKLRAFPRGHGDAFIWATVASDLDVTGLLTDPDVAVVQRTLPARAPELPEGVDRVWVASTLVGCRAIVSEAGRWRWVDWVTDVEFEADEGV